MLAKSGVVATAVRIRASFAAADDGNAREVAEVFSGMAIAPCVSNLVGIAADLPERNVCSHADDVKLST
jgi:hypothetical protein